jgi:tetratricopeptide (TPR) repeat protein
MLAAMDPGYWAALGYMNIAADYGKRDLNPSRALVALRVALAMSDEDIDSSRSQELRSRLLVRAGHLAHKHEDHDKAISFLEKVPLESYSTPQGLYLHGLALSATGNHRAAMQSWHRARKYPLAYPGVANAWLGTGRGYDLSGYLGQAGEAFLAANASFESERVTLRKLADQIRDKGAYQALVRDARDSNAEWFLADSRTLTQPRTAYLLRFMEQPRAQEAVNRVAELEQIGQELARREDSLVVFRSAIQERLETGTNPPAQVAGYMDEIKALSERITELGERATSADQQKALRDASSTLAALKSSFGKLDQRLAAKDRRLTELLARTDRALEKVRANRNRAGRLKGKAETALDEIAEGGRRVFQVGPSMGDVGKGEKQRLDGDAAQGIAHGQGRAIGERGRHRNRQTGQRRGHAEQHGPRNGLAEPRSIRQVVDDRGQSRPDDPDHQGAETEQRHRHDERLALQKGRHRVILPALRGGAESSGARSNRPASGSRRPDHDGRNERRADRVPGGRLHSAPSDSPVAETASYSGPPQWKLPGRAVRQPETAASSCGSTGCPGSSTKVSGRSTQSGFGLDR